MKNTKNNRHIFISALITALALLLSGCSLAKEDAGSDAGDALIGVFITDDYLDLFDMDAWLNANAYTLEDQSDTIINDAGEYTDPLYAEIDRHGSDDPADWDISFKGIKGLNFLVPSRADDNGAITNTLKADDGICDAQMNSMTTDDSSETEISATIYSIPTPSDPDFAYYANPVYQTADGKIYTVPGSGISTVSAMDEGEVISTTFRDETKSWDNKNTKTKKATITIRNSIMYEPVAITLIQMNAKNEFVKKEEYLPGRLPEKLTAEKNTAYFIVETDKKAPDGNIQASRSIYGPEQTDDEIPLETFYVINERTISTQQTEINWEK